MTLVRRMFSNPTISFALRKRRRPCIAVCARSRSVRRKASRQYKKTGEEIDEPEKLEVEELGIYDGSDEFSEFPEWDSDDTADILEQCYVVPGQVPDPDPILYEHTKRFLKLVKQVWNPETRRLEDRPADTVPRVGTAETSRFCSGQSQIRRKPWS